jgi:hypothetical protein
MLVEIKKQTVISRTKISKSANRSDHNRDYNEAVAHQFHGDRAYNNYTYSEENNQNTTPRFYYARRRPSLDMKRLQTRNGIVTGSTFPQRQSRHNRNDTNQLLYIHDDHALNTNMRTLSTSEVLPLILSKLGHYLIHVRLAGR